MWVKSTKIKNLQRQRQRRSVEAFHDDLVEVYLFIYLFTKLKRIQIKKKYRYCFAYVRL